MGRDRYQEGRVVLVGKRVKKWRGHFYVYQRQADGSEVRRFRNILLGFKAQMDKGESRAKLRDIIARETKNVAPAPVNVTFRWFYENRYLPQKEEQWKVTSRPKTKRFIENYLLKRFGEAMLPDLDKFALQTTSTNWPRIFPRVFSPKSAFTLIRFSMRPWNWSSSARIRLQSSRCRANPIAGVDRRRSVCAARFLTQIFWGFYPI